MPSEVLADVLPHILTYLDISRGSLGIHPVSFHLGAVLGNRVY